MEKESAIRKRLPPIVIAHDLLEENLSGIPRRHVFGSTGISIALHAVGFLILSAILVAQQQTSEPLVTQATLGEDTGDSEFLETEPIDLPATNNAQTDLLGLTAQAANHDLMKPSSESINLSDVGNRLSDNSMQGLPGAIAAIAGSVQGRVARAGGQKGEVQFSLAWESLNDVDLHVIAPSGEHISYSHRSSKCHGELDVDMNAGTVANAGSKDFSDEPVENVRWLARKAPSGRFTVLVHQFRWRKGRNSDNFQLLVNLGKQTQVVEGVVTAERPIAVYRFQYARSSSPERQKKMVEQYLWLQEREESDASERVEQSLKLSAGQERDERFREIISKYPHTDAALRAMQELQGSDKN